MNRSLSAALKSVRRPGRRVAVCLAAVAGAVALVVSATPAETTGAWFAIQKTVTGNTVASATMQAPLTVNATSTLAGNNVAWSPTLDQQWATAAGLKSGISYTVTRTVDGGSATNVYSGSATAAFDAYPVATQVTDNSVSVDQVAVGSGGAQAIALDRSGTVWTWGDWTSSDSQLAPTKLALPGDRRGAQVSAGGTSSGAILATDGTVWMFGRWVNSWTPVQIPTPNGRQIVSIAVPFGGKLLNMLASDGTVWNSPDASPPTTPTQIVLPGSRLASQLTNNMTVLATDGTVWTWGGYGLLFGNGSDNGATTATPVQAIFPQGTVIKRISSNQINTIALDSAGYVWAWGQGNYGQLAAGDSNNASKPRLTQYSRSTSIIDIITSASQTSVLYDDGTIWSAGANSYGQFGDGTPSTSVLSPIQTSTPTGKKITQITVSQWANLKVDGDGNVWAQGTNLNGAFGNGVYNSSVSGMGPAPANPQVNVSAATGLTVAPRTALTSLSCANGGTPQSGYCPFAGNVAYSVSYSLGTWTAPARSVAVASTASPVSSGVILGPNNMCLDIAGNSPNRGAAVDFWTCNGVSGQTWTLWSDGTLRSNTFCLDIAEDSSTPGAMVGTWTCTGKGGQVWVPRGDGTLFNPRSGACLDGKDGSATPGAQLSIRACASAVTATQTWTFVSNNAIGPLVGINGLCVDNDSNTARDNNRIMLWSCEQNVGQRWFKLPDGTLRSYNMCMSVVRNSTAPGAKIELLTCNGSTGQQWARQADSSWKNPASGLCLGDPTGAYKKETQFALTTCSGDATQRWATQGDGNLVLGPGSSGYCLDLVGNKSDDGTAVDLYTCNGVSGQNWTAPADGTIRTRGKCMSVVGGTPTVNSTQAKIELRACTPGDLGQQWVKQPNSSLKNPVSGLCLDTPGGTPSAGLQLQLWVCTNDTPQRWTFI